MEFRRVLFRSTPFVYKFLLDISDERHCSPVEAVDLRRGLIYWKHTEVQMSQLVPGLAQFHEGRNGVCDFFVAFHLLPAVLRECFPKDREEQVGVAVFPTEIRMELALNGL